MQVTRALEYANRAMVLLAQHYGNQPLVVAKIAAETSAPPNFLHQVLNNLARAGLLVSRRGMTRGYELARPPAEISLLDIFEIIQGPLGLTSCTVEGNWCPREGACSLSTVWHEIQTGIRDKLEAATLEKLSVGHRVDGGCPLPVD